MNAFYIEKDQNYQEESTTYWFDVDGEIFGVCESGPESDVLDCDGCPLNLEDAKNAPLRSLPEYVTDEIRQ